ncbi:MAG TPA: MlaD family protein [Verrucomicrobiae bacterium]|jgi:paraquat-inducible protein B
MNEKSHGLPKAKVEKNYFSWALWLVPLAAVGMCVYFVLHDVVFAGPTITIYFQSADGLQEQNSMVIYRGIKIGQIQSLKLGNGGQSVVVRAKLDHSASDVAREGAIFWIVRPELKLGSISGLRTIVSGNYVAVQPGDGARTNQFIGAEKPPLTMTKAIQITLLTDDVGSLEAQSPIFYRGIQVGEVTDFHLSDMASNVVVNARILDDYAPLVRVNSQFWNAGGINFHAGLFSGIEISAESAQTIVSGGIAFATPPNYGAQATNGAVFPLNKKENEDWKTWDPAIELQGVPEGQKAKNSLPQFNQ